MEKENRQRQATEGMKSLRREFEAAAKAARASRGKTLRNWFTGEKPRRDEAVFGSYAKRLQQAEALFASSDAEDTKKARALLMGLRREFRVVAKAHRALPLPGMGGKTLAAHPAVTSVPHPKAAQFGAYARQVDAIVRLMK